MNPYSSIGYTSNRCSFETQYFYYFNSFPIVFSSNKTEHPFVRSFVFLYGLEMCNSPKKLSFAVYLLLNRAGNKHRSSDNDRQ